MYISGIKTNLSTFFSCYLSLSPQSDIISVADHNGRLSFCTCKDGQLTMEWEGVIHNSCSGIGMLPSGNYLVTSGHVTDRKINVFFTRNKEGNPDFSSGPIYEKKTPNGGSALSIHPSTPIIAFGGFPDRYEIQPKPNIHFFRVFTSEDSITLSPDREALSSEYNVWSISWDKTGCLCGIAEGEVDDGFAGTNGVARVFRWEEEETGWSPVLYTHFSQVVKRIVFHPFRNIAAISYEDKIRFVDLENGATISTKRKLGIWSGVMTFTPDGNYLAVGDRRSIVLIDPFKLSIANHYSLEDSPNTMIYSPDGVGLFVLLNNGYLLYMNV